MNEDRITLSLETAVRGGSISLRRGIEELDFWLGQQEVSKSEDILDEIDRILKRNELKKKSIDRIIVSRGPGSYTGVRIGIAIGMGLKKALDCDLLGVSLFEAMLVKSSPGGNVSAGETITAVPFGKRQICLQIYRTDKRGFSMNRTESHLLTNEDFVDFCKASAVKSERKFILHHDIYADLQNLPGIQTFPENCLIDAGKNLAGVIGVFGAVFPNYEKLRPIYLSDDIYSDK